MTPLRRTRASVRGAAAFALLVGAPAALEAQVATALVSQIRGDVKVRKEGGEAELPAKVGLRLVQGDAVNVARGSRAVLLFNNGRLVTATTPLVVAPVGGAGAAEVYDRAARTLASAEAAQRPRTGGGVGRPPPAGAYPLAPAFGSATVAQRPTFTWQAQDGTEEYLLQIRPVTGGAPLRFRVGGAGPWTLPDTAAALERGAEYAWTVVALPGGRLAGEERFRVLDGESAAELTDFLAMLRDAGADPEGDGLLIAAMYYADLGLLHEAEAALGRLATQTDAAGRDPAVDLLHAQVLERLGRIEEAVAVYAAAKGEGLEPYLEP